ncbi:MAG TPA: hypothetical protein VFN55_13415 [Solirubrobacteraceae bacterium]|nr:hypothetical protein [Solirubrobacteraceae bacterium]
MRAHAPAAPLRPPQPAGRPARTGRPAVDPALASDPELIRRVAGLRAALEAATRDNAALRRELTRLERENDRLRGLRSSAPHARAREAMRTALWSRSSRNP